MSDPTLLDLMRMRDEAIAEYNVEKSTEIPNLIKCNRLKSRLVELEKNIAVVSTSMTFRAIEPLPRLPNGNIDMTALSNSVADDISIDACVYLELDAADLLRSLENLDLDSVTIYTPTATQLKVCEDVPKSCDDDSWTSPPPKWTF